MTIAMSIIIRKIAPAKITRTWPRLRWRLAVVRGILGSVVLSVDMAAARSVTGWSG